MKLSAIFDKKSALLAAIFVLFVLLLEYFAFRAYQTHVFSLWKYPGTFLGTVNFYIAFFLGYVVAAVLLWASAYFSLASPLPAGLIYWLFFALSAFWEYTFQHLYGRFSTVQDLSLAFITTSSQKTDAIASYTSWLAIIPCLVYLVLLLIGRKRDKFSLRKSLALLACFATVLIGFNLAMGLIAPRYYFYEAWNNSFGAGSRTVFGYLFNKISYSPPIRENVPPLSPNSRPPNNIVLVLDESVRGDHLSINGYARETTPFLDDLARRNALHNWGITAAASTRSVESFQYIITGVTPDEPGDIWKTVSTSPTILQYAKAANYRTYYLDGQGNDYWGGGGDDLKYVDILLGTKYFDPQGDKEWEIDKQIGIKTQEIISRSTGNFILIFKRGSHTPYNRNFPPGSETWHPTSKTFAHNLLNMDLETFINTYDNSVKYNLESFFRALVLESGVLPDRTVILYTSDHGQTLSEDGGIYSHGGETRKEAIVPLFIIGDAGGYIDTSYKAMHANIVPTLLDLMSFPEEKRTRKYALSLLKARAADSRERYFITPNVMPGEKIISTTTRIKFD